MNNQIEKVDAKAKLLDAALTVIRTKGFTATTVDELCSVAGVSKGAFFHHFKNKDEFGVAAAEFWTEATAELYANAPYHKYADPLDRIIGYLEFRKSLLRDGGSDFTCLISTMIQETYETAPAICDACARSIRSHAMTLEADIKKAMRVYNISAEWTAKSLALHTQAVLQGAFTLAKVKRERAIAVESVDHLVRYLRLLFKPKNRCLG